MAVSALHEHYRDSREQRYSQGAEYSEEEEEEQGEYSEAEQEESEQEPAEEQEELEEQEEEAREDEEEYEVEEVEEEQRRVSAGDDEEEDHDLRRLITSTSSSVPQRPQHSSSGALPPSRSRSGFEDSAPTAGKTSASSSRRRKGGDRAAAVGSSDARGDSKTPSSGAPKGSDKVRTGGGLPAANATATTIGLSDSRGLSTLGGFGATGDSLGAFSGTGLSSRPGGGAVGASLEQVGFASASSTGRLDPAITRYAGDLRQALDQANQGRGFALDRLRSFEAQAERDEAEIHVELRAAKAQLEAVRSDHRSAARRELRNHRVELEIHEVQSERDAMARSAGALQSELMQVRAQVQVQQQQYQAQLAMQADAAAAQAAQQAASMEAAESSLRAEAAALRSALALCERRREDGARAAAREAEALLRREEAQLEERRELEAAEERLRIERDRTADALALRLGGSAAIAAAAAGALVCSPEAFQEAALQVEEREERCREAQADLEALHEECGHLLRLNGAAEARVEELEERLAGGGLRATVDRAAAMLRRLDQEAFARGEEELRGAARLVFVLAQVCGVPRMAYLALDSNRSGRVSMCEFDSGLRLRIGLDYESIVAMPAPVLRPLFKEFDLRKKGYLAEEDFSRCYPEIWAEYGRKGWPISAPEHRFLPPSRSKTPDGSPASNTPRSRNRSAPVGARIGR